MDLEVTSKRTIPVLPSPPRLPQLTLKQTGIKGLKKPSWEVEFDLKDSRELQSIVEKISPKLWELGWGKLSSCVPWISGN